MKNLNFWKCFGFIASQGTLLTGNNYLTLTIRDRRGTERKGTERVPPVPFPERNGTGTQNQGTQRNGNPKLGNVGTRSVPLRSPILNIFLVNFSLKRIQKVKNFAYGVNNDKSDIIIAEIEL